MTGPMKQLAPIGQKQYEKNIKDMADTQTPLSLNEPVKMSMLPLLSLKAQCNQSAATN